MDLSLHVAQKLSEFGVQKSDKLLVAISGGMDSMLLWETLRLLKYSTVGVHINYNLRGEDSKKDEHLVRSYAEENSLDLEVFQGDPENFRTNLQEEARLFRYQKFEEVKRTHSIDWLLTGHHLDDDAETFFLNLVRGAGIRGLKGISEKRDQVLRPFLELSKAQLNQKALEFGLAWREDESNQSGKYLRNKIRHSIILKIKELDARAEQGLQSSMRILKSQNEVFNLLLNDFREKHLEEYSGYTSLKLSEVLVSQPQLLFEVLAPFGHFQVEKIIASKNESGKQFISETHTIYLDRGRLLIAENSTEVEVYETLPEYSGEGDSAFLKFESLEQLPSDFKFTSDVAAFDQSILDFPLTLRNWKKGDSFQPFGMKGRKKVSDYLIDNKVPLPLKSKVLVLTSNGEIIWLVGHRTDERFKVSQKSKKIYLANLLK
jgi:tRNA(Ile)-lysidine synthase